ncbi:MAG: hypothetical protein V2A73_13170 [Pseudomonadota bacterium]
MPERLRALRAPIMPERTRRIGGESFSFIPHRFLRDGFLSAMSRDELALYIFLVVAGNREGVSFYRYDAICSSLGMILDDYLTARKGLIEKNLIAFDGTRFQVLSLPDRPPQSHRAPLTTDDDLERHDPATICSITSKWFKTR